MPEGGAPRIINATILFIDLMNSVALSNSLTLWDYNKLINEYQETLRKVLAEIGQWYPIGEYYLGGDQLAVFFYDPSQGEGKDYEEAAAQKLRNRMLYGALRMAVAVKNAWISHPLNLARLEGDQPVLDLSIGINSGNVVIERRVDGEARIEGFAINLAKRVQGYARYGRYCKVMLSKNAYDIYRGIVVQHVMLKQRAFFEAWTPQEGALKGLAPGTEVHELKFFHRLTGFGIRPESVGTYERIFERDPTNFWAYTNLMNYYLYDIEAHGRALAVAERALYSNPLNEKIHYDLAILHLHNKDFEVARQYAQECLRHNSQMDIALDVLSEVEMATSGDVSRTLEHVSRALTLSPGCATYQINMAGLLFRSGMERSARDHYLRAVALYPNIAELEPDVAALFEPRRKAGEVQRETHSASQPAPAAAAPAKRQPRVKR